LAAGQNTPDKTLPTHSGHEGFPRVMGLDEKCRHQAAAEKEENQIEDECVPVFAWVEKEILESRFPIQGEVRREGASDAEPEVSELGLHRVSSPGNLRRMPSRRQGSRCASSG
jgi:hypothetical protein